MSMFNPPSPDVANAGAAQGQALTNVQTGLNTGAAQQSQQGSMVGQNNAYGSLNYTQTGTGANGTPLYTANVQLSPEQQQLYNQLTGTQTSAGQQAGNLISGANYGGQSPADAIGSLTGGLTQQMMGAETSYLDPFFNTQTSQLNSQLLNEGLDTSSPAYQNAMRQNQTNQGLTVSNFEAAALPQTMQQATTEYELPAQLGENLAQFGAPTGPNSSFAAAPGLNITPANLTSAVSTENQANQAQYQDQMQQYTNMMNGIFGTGSAVLGGWASGGGGAGALGALALSDRRYKKNINRISTLKNGLPVYSFQYIWGGPDQIGLMADEVERVHSNAVIEINGVKYVDYALAVV